MLGERGPLSATLLLFVLLWAGRAWGQAAAPSNGMGIAAPVVALIALAFCGIIIVLSIRAFYRRGTRRLVQGFKSKEKVAEARQDRIIERLRRDGLAMRSQIEKAQERATIAEGAIAAASGSDAGPDALLLKHRDRDVQVWLERQIEQLWHPNILGVKVGPFQAMALDRDFLSFEPFSSALAGRRGIANDDPADSPIADRPLALGELLRAATRFVMIGGPGSGKTAALRSIALAYAREKTQERFGFRDARLPVYVSLAALDATDFTLQVPDVLWRHMIGTGQPDQVFIEGHARAGSLVFLFDDLNAIASPDAREAAVRWIEGCARKYPKNLYVVATRPSTYGASLRFAPEFLELQIAPLPSEQLEVASALVAAALELTRREPSTRPDAVGNDVARTLSRVQQAVEAVGNPRLFATPLSVGILAVSSHVDTAPPRSESERFARALTAQFGSKDVFGAEPPLVNADVTGRILGQLAFRFQSLGRSSMERGVIVNLVTDMLRGQSVDAGMAEAVLDRLMENTTLLRPAHRGSIRFLTPAVRECLTAMYLAEHTDTAMLAARVQDPCWHEVIVHFCGLRDAEELMQRLLYMDEEQFATHWPALWRCAQQTYGDQAAEGAFGRRALESLKVALGSANRAVRMSAAHGLGELRSEGCSPLLINALEDRHSSVRRAAVRALTDMGAPNAIQPILGRLADVDESSEVRCQAAAAMASFGHDDASAALKLATEDPSRSVREAARAALKVLARTIAT